LQDERFKNDLKKGLTNRINNNKYNIILLYFEIVTYIFCCAVLIVIDICTSTHPPYAIHERPKPLLNVVDEIKFIEKKRQKKKKKREDP